MSKNKVCSHNNVFRQTVYLTANYIHLISYDSKERFSLKNVNNLVNGVPGI